MSERHIYCALTEVLVSGFFNTAILVPHLLATNNFDSIMHEMMSHGLGMSIDFQKCQFLCLVQLFVDFVFVF